MKKTLQVLAFVLALATAIAIAQATSGSSGTQSSGQWGPSAHPSDQGTAAPASQDVNAGKHDKKSAVDDDTLNQQVRQQLAGDTAMKNVQATVSNGVVDLEGTVATKADKKRAKQMVAGIPGVHKVHDRLKVNANATATPGSNEPTTASTGTSGAATASSTRNTAGSIAGNAGVSSTTPQTPSASTNTSTATTGGSSTAGNGMPQGDAAPGANAGVSSAAPQTQSSTATSGTSTTMPQASTTGTTGMSGASANSTVPQASTTGSTGTAGANPTLPQSSATTGTAGTTGTTDTSTLPAPGTGATATADQAGLGDLQKQIQTALKHEPTLANDHINATVAGDTIQLTGDVASGKERQTALRIAQSFAGNRRVVDRMTVAGQGPGAGMTGGSSGQTGVSGTGTSGAGTSNPTSTPSSPTAPPESTNNPR